MTSLDVSLPRPVKAGPSSTEGEEDSAGSATEAWTADTFIQFATLREAYRSWHERQGALEWLQSNEHAVTLLAAYNVRPAHFAWTGNAEAPAQLTLVAPCCDTTAVLAEEERLALIGVPRVLPFHASACGSSSSRSRNAASTSAAAQPESSSVADSVPIYATELQRQHRLLGQLLRRCHQDGCVWRDRPGMGERDSERDEHADLCVRQLLLGSPSLCLTDSATVRAFCAGVVVRPASTSGAAEQQPPARLRCLLPRGSPPSVVWEWSESTLSALDATTPPADGPAVRKPALRYRGSSVNDRILQLFFSPKKRLRADDGGSSGGDVGGELVLQYMALLISLYGYDVTPAERHWNEREEEDGPAGTQAETAAPAPHPAPSHEQISVPLDVTENTEGDRHTLVERVRRRRTVAPEEVTEQLLRRHVGCRFCAHAPVVHAVCEEVATTTTTTITTVQTALQPALVDEDAAAEQARAVPQDIEACDEARDGETAYSEAAGSGGERQASEDVMDAIAEVEAALLRAAQLDAAQEPTGEGEHQVMDCGDSAAEEAPQYAKTAAAATPASSGNEEEAEDAEVWLDAEHTANDGTAEAKKEEEDEEVDEGQDGGEVPEGGENAATLAKALAEVDTGTSFPSTSTTAAPPATATVITHTHTKRHTQTQNTVTVTFSRRELAQDSGAGSSTSCGHHDGCPWKQLFLSDVIDAAALAAPMRFMDFTWDVADQDARSHDVDHHGTDDQDDSAEATTSDAQQAPAPRVSDAGEVEDGDVDGETSSSQTSLTMRFDLAEVERLITTWRLSEEWERMRPAQYLRHPLWRTWVSSATLHPVHTERADGVMETFLRNLERQRTPTAETAERDAKARVSEPVPTSLPTFTTHNVSAAHTLQSSMMKPSAMLGSMAELSQAVGMPLCHVNATTSNRTVETALRLASDAMRRCFASESSSAVGHDADTVAARAARTSSARGLLQEGFQVLQGAAAPVKATGVASAAASASVAGTDAHTHRLTELAVEAFLQQAQQRYAAHLAAQSAVGEARLRVALQRDVLPRAVHRFTSATYPSLSLSAPSGDEEGSDNAAGTETLAYAVHPPPALSSLSAAGAPPSTAASAMSAADRVRVEEFLKAMRETAQEEQMLLQRARERQEAEAAARRQAEEKAAAAVAAAAAAAAAAKARAAAPATAPSAPGISRRQPPTPGPTNTLEDRGSGAQIAKQQQLQQQLQHSRQHQQHKHQQQQQRQQHPPLQPSGSSVFGDDGVGRGHGSGGAGGGMPFMQGFENPLWGPSPPPQNFPQSHSSPPPFVFGSEAAQHPGGSAIFPAPLPEPHHLREPQPFFSDNGLAGGPGPAFGGDGSAFFGNAPPDRWSPQPSSGILGGEPAGGSGGGILGHNPTPHLPGGAPQRGRPSDPTLRGSGSVLGTLSGGGGSGGGEDLRLSNWSTGSAQHTTGPTPPPASQPQSTSPSSGGVLGQSSAPGAARRDGAGHPRGGGASGGGNAAAAPGVLSAPPASGGPSTQRGGGGGAGGGGRGRGGGGRAHPPQPSQAPPQQPQQQQQQQQSGKGHAAQPVLGNAGAGRGGHGRGRGGVGGGGGGGGGQRRGGGGGRGGGGFRRGG